MIQLIQAATLMGASQEQRSIAEQKIIQMRMDQTDNFFIETCAIFQNNQLPNDIRQSSGTVIDISILTEVNQMYLWDRLQQNTKQQVKDAVLSVLVDQDRNIRRAAANIIAAMCCIQIPRNQWDGIVEKISSNIGNEDPLIKQVSILTLGFVCQRLKDKKSFIFSSQLQEVILSGILLGLKQNQKQIIQTALKALINCISSMADIMSNPQYRDYLINQIVGVIQNDQYKNYGLQIITEFAKSSYQHLTHYFNGFVTLLEPIIVNTKDDQNCIQAMQFFESVATEYKYRYDEDINTKNYITGPNGQKIVTWLLQNLCSADVDEDNEDNGVIDSASKCLQSIFEEDSTAFQKLVLNFTSNTIKHQSWKYRQASIRAFAIFLIGLDDKRKQQLVNASLLELVALLNDQSKIVQYSAIKSINLITEQCAEIFIHHANFLDILKLIVSKLSISQGFLKNVCKIIDNLCVICIQTGQKSFTNFADDLIQLLFDTSLTNNSTLHVINCCVVTIMNLISAAFNSDVSKKYVDFVLTHFQDIKKLQSEKRDLLYASFFTLLQTCLISLRKETLNMDTLSNIYNLVINHYTSFSKVDSDGLYVIGTLSNFFKNQIRLVEDFWKYVEYALTQYTQSHILKAGISCVSDFATNYGPSLGDRIPKLMSYILESLQKSQVTRQSKLDLIMCLGQLFLNCGRQCLPYLAESMRLLIVACQASITLNDSDRQYAENLRQNIIDTFTCMLHGLNDEYQTSQQYFVHVPNIFEFIKVSCNRQLQPKLTYVKCCILWMADASKFYKNQLQNFVKQSWVWQCLQLLKKHNKNKSLDDVINYAKENF